ncbi:hypothetical protein RJJ65_12210 [Rhizobium hidalgonense]|uniref:Uncharacterized protein n=1 Tax=Rhizobium hidalgonense TaxID=1538159 RepID=A0AAJ2GVS7_9HYPH|nr:hypothetical protein [Rhizobium hidalgonense]MDR9773413.1 hypothetical protein [Rhizobium hidalgonense]MDR9810292.1 hypothetical protein [Rhizobium hidalgonense]MDR9818917.1 hypothetical protein [Rhizobium hidalgonense]
MLASLDILNSLFAVLDGLDAGVDETMIYSRRSVRISGLKAILLFGDAEHFDIMRQEGIMTTHHLIRHADNVPEPLIDFADYACAFRT